MKGVGGGEWRFNIVFPIQSERRRSRTFKFPPPPLFIQPAAWFLEMFFFFCVVAHIVRWFKIGFFGLFFFSLSLPTLMLYLGSGGTRRLISLSGRMETQRHERRGGEGRIRRGAGASERASGWPGEDASGGETCIGSHCASNVITGSDSSVWHAALPICQREIGRVTNGYHCDLPQPPQTPHPAARTSASLSSTGGGAGGGGESDLNLGGSPRVGGPLWL